MIHRATAVLFITLVCGVIASHTSAQQPQAPDPQLPEWEIDNHLDPAREAERAFDRDVARIRASTAAAQSKNVEINRLAGEEFDRGRESVRLRSARAQFELTKGISFHELSKADKATLAPSAEDAAQFAYFLSQPDTGLIRLLPRDPNNFNGKLSVRGGGAYYSFAHLVHEYNYGSDIGLEQGNFLTGFAGASYGFISDLGDVPLENLLVEAEPVSSLASFKPPSAEPEARKIQTQLRTGYPVGESVYTRRGVPAVVGHTYLLRSVDYRMSDVLVAFRVVRKDDDGSVVLLWKMLKKFPEPRLEPDGARRD
ncbi:MAG TPA: hypothetical protein VLJ61_11270 [Pyrinomonadaceae bacterium]|nr:hypothetical protein [Pyrinomonadaceae bacterium]